MKRFLLMMFMFASNLFCYPQTCTNYVGKGKMYQHPANFDSYLIYIANYSYANETTFGEHITANNLCVSTYPYKEFHNYSSSHGDYIEIQHSQRLAGTFWSTFSKRMLFWHKLYGLCAFTKQDKRLYLVQFYEDRVIAVFFNNFIEESDFSIFVEDVNVSRYELEPHIFILNNGMLHYYENISSITSFANSVKKEIVDSKKYDIQGVEIDYPRNEKIYIQDGKKILTK